MFMFFTNAQSGLPLWLKWLMRVSLLYSGYLLIDMMLSKMVFFDHSALLIFCVFLALLYEAILPLIKLLFLPLNIVSLGLFNAILSGVILPLILFAGIVYWIPGVEVEGLGTMGTLWYALLFWIYTTLVFTFTRSD
jgi:uncharacterized membrane protein YvlD (DUF360 family)